MAGKRRAEKRNQTDKMELVKKVKEEETPVPLSQDDIVLNDDQQRVYDAVLEDRRNFVILGFAGTGKSTLLLKMVKGLEERKRRVSVSSMTGASAVVINGRTLHSTLAMGLARPVDFLSILHTPGKQDIWRDLDVLFIDECSMMDGNLLAKIDETAKVVRKNAEPLGGIQIILMGDLFQILPVKLQIHFFLTVAFASANFDKMTLSKFERAKDEELQRIMQRIIHKEFDATDLAILNRPNPLISIEDTSIPHLHSTHKPADAYNDKCLRRLKEEIFVYPSEERRRNGSRDFTMDLCVGARVMHTMNNAVLVNGSMGTVTHTDKDYVIVDFDREGELWVSLTTRDKNEKNPKKFMPLIVAFAITIHKAQGLTFPKVVVFGHNMFEVGQGMTAISRTRYLKDALFVDMNMGTALVDDDCKMYQLGESAPTKEVSEADDDDNFLY